MTDQITAAPPGSKTGPRTRTIEYNPATGELMTLQMGPQHPSTHGVLRLEVDLAQLAAILNDNFGVRLEHAASLSQALK